MWRRCGIVALLFSRCSYTDCKARQREEQKTLPKIQPLLWTSAPPSWKAGKYVSSCPVPPPPPSFSPLCTQIPLSVCREFTVVLTPVQLLRARRAGGLPWPGVRARSQGCPAWHLAVGAGRKLSEPDWNPCLHWTVVTASVGADQQPDTGNTTTGRHC